jgi:choline dehydrogenase-like flavoprotein
MFRDGQGVETGTSLHFDVAIVGGGMAGITLAERLRGDGRRVCLIEGGGYDPELRHQRLNQGLNVGRPYFGLDRCRFRVFGGASIRWGGWCRPIEPSDLDARDWIPRSGWPISYEQLAPHIPEAAAVVEIAPSFALSDWKDLLPPVPDLGAPEFEPVIMQHSAEIDFGERARPAFTAGEDLTVLLNANVTELTLAPGTNRLERVEIATVSGNRFSVHADTFVLAAGGVENPRLLLASRRERPAGLGNESDFVGRCFMEHPHVSPGHIVPAQGHTLPSFFKRSELGREAWVHGILAPTAAAARARQLPTCFFTLDTMPHVAGPSALLDLPQSIMTPVAVAYRRLQRNYPAAGTQLRKTVSTAWRTGRELRASRGVDDSDSSNLRTLISVYARCEQTPNPSSRVTLDDTRDRLGVPRPRLDWRIADSDLAAVDTWTDTLDRTLRDSGFGHFVRSDWRRKFVGGPHHMGTTRMSSSPGDGVVDANCKVHSVDNLYVTGSSVFTTGGHANPSLTMLALTLRLADHLRDQLDTPVTAVSSPVAADLASTP